MLQRRLPIGAAQVLLATGALALSGCLPLPVHTGSAVEGRVVDAATGRPLSGAVVVVRFDARHGDVLPDRDLLGHVEVTTDAEGRFDTGIFLRPGLTVFPLARTEARVAGVMVPGYRCPRPRAPASEGPLRIALQRALDRDERRESCRPLAATPREIPRYLAAWQDLYPQERDARHAERDRRVERLLVARRVFGYGENCSGPAFDLALAPGGERFAFAVRDGDRTRVAVEPVASAVRGAARGAARRAEREWIAVSPPAGGETRRLAWTDRRALVLWEPAGVADGAAPTSVLSVADAPLEVLWRAPEPPAAPGAVRRVSVSAASPGRPLELADLQDEGDVRWGDRTFALRRTLDPVSGLPVDWLEVRRGNGDARVLELPGEACGPTGRFGRPHHRIAADGRTALDLRFVDGGCRPVALDLETGSHRRLDAVPERATCETERRIPADRLATALGGYAGEIEAALGRGGADPTASYALRIAPDGRAEASSRDPRGDAVRVALPPFPLDTPLRRVEVSVVGGGGPAGRVVPGIEPL